MKKFLGIFGLVGLLGASSTSVISCAKQEIDNFVAAYYNGNNPFYNDFESDNKYTTTLTEQILYNFTWNFSYSLFVLKNNVDTDSIINEFNNTEKTYQDLLNITYSEQNPYKYFLNGGQLGSTIDITSPDSEVVGLVTDKNNNNYYFANAKLFIFTYESVDSVNTKLALDTKLEKFIVYRTQFRCYDFDKTTTLINK
ncbi:lipoprotein [Spiroplasma endosymbiont of Labia minor]|uniref:lipoprotein n=1 Tax=Spiroplasma endosymbiont of Labia minor TaxID=3066305 RepID=UPI0030CA7BC5